MRRHMRLLIIQKLEQPIEQVVNFVSLRDAVAVFSTHIAFPTLDVAWNFVGWQVPGQAFAFAMSRIGLM